MTEPNSDQIIADLARRVGNLEAAAKLQPHRLDDHVDVDVKKTRGAAGVPTYNPATGLWEVGAGANGAGLWSFWKGEHYGGGGSPAAIGPNTSGAINHWTWQDGDNSLIVNHPSDPSAIQVRAAGLFQCSAWIIADANGAAGYRTGNVTIFQATGPPGRVDVSSLADTLAGAAFATPAHVVPSTGEDDPTYGYMQATGGFYNGSGTSCTFTAYAWIARIAG